MEPILTDKEREAVANFGALKYPAEKMAIVLGWEEATVRALMGNKKSDFFQAYERGKTLSDYKLDVKLLELAMGGDLKAMELIRGTAKRKKPDEV